MDAIAFPSSWEFGKTTIKDGCSPLGDPYCPSVTRYVLAGEDLVSVYAEARAAVAAAGFGQIQDISPHCDGVAGGPSCGLFAQKNGARLDLNVYAPGQDVDQLGLAAADQATVRVIIRPG
jgi:hypothetical protein